MAGQLNIKLLVASVHNLRVLLILFNFILYISCNLMALVSILIEKFPVHVLISILQSFNCRCREVFVHILFLFKFKAKTHFNKRVTSQFQCNIINTFRSNLYFSFVYLIASCYRAIIGIVGLLDVRCKVLF